MERILASIFLGFCLFLGNFSGHVKTLKIVGHISSHHSKVHTHHNHEHEHHHPHKSEKKSKKHEHSHTLDLSIASVNIVLPSYDRVIYSVFVGLSNSEIFVSLNNLSLLSFSPNIFRPPIA